MEGLGHLRTWRSLEARDEAMDVARYPKISHEFPVEREDRRAVPPDMLLSGLHAKELFAVIAMEPELPEDLVPLFSESKDVGRVPLERTGTSST